MPNENNGGHRQARRPEGYGATSSGTQFETGTAGNTGSTGMVRRTGATEVYSSQTKPMQQNKKQSQAAQLLMDAQQLELLRLALRTASLYINCRHLEMLTPAHPGDLYTSEVCALDSVHKSYSGISVHKITKLMFNEEENSYEKLVSVYSAMNSFGGIVALLLKSDGNVAEFYLCTNISGDGETAGQLLTGNVRGHFPGCEMTKLDAHEKAALLDSINPTRISSKRTIRSLSMIPSRREDEQHQDRAFTSQDYEKLIDAMSGRPYTLLILSQSIAPEAMDESREGLESIYTSISPYAKETVSYGENESDSVNYAISTGISSSMSNSVSRSFGTSYTNSVSNGRSYNKGRGYSLFDVHFNNGSGSSFSTSSSNGSNQGKSTSSGTSESTNQGENQGYGSSTGSNRSLTLNRDNKAVIDLLEKLEEHIKRINQSQTFGMWNTACYVIADDAETAYIGTSTLSALLSGDSSATPRAYCNQWDATCPKERSRVLEYLQYLRHPVIDLSFLQEIDDGRGSVSYSSYQSEQLTPAMMVSGRELPLLMNFPRKSVPGIVVGSMAEFGRNIPEKWKKNVERPIVFGNIRHMGQTEPTEVVLDLDTFSSHVFICGASGSGKSNTTYNLLQKLIEKGVHFLVIEPAKGEYKTEFAGLNNVNIFTATDSPWRRLQINPFEFNPRIHIREHLDKILQVVSACWPLYGAMPSILKQAFEQVYIEHGWDLDHSERIIEHGSRFPVFQELIPVLNRIIDNSSYSKDAKGDYKGALVNRVLTLCNGFEGQIFGASRGISDRTLFAENTIIDLSGVGSDETRSLIMGILIIKLRNYRKAMATVPNAPLTHVTVLEEAHNILKRCNQETNAESGNIQGAAVGSLCQCIAEMRSSGEGFMIIDQSPGAVDAAAIKNTAIKIVMRLSSKDDCEEIGTALSLENQQVRELSRLEVGVAAIFHVGWTQTILAKMGEVWDKRYRLKEAPRLDNGIYTRVQGAVIQQMYRAMREKTLENVFPDIRSLIKLLCTGNTALKPVLPVAKQQELLESVQLFLLDNDELLRRGKRSEMQAIFAKFVFELIHLDSVMKIFPLTLPPEDPKATPKDAKLQTQAITRIAVKWESEIRQGFARYLNMPEKCDPDRTYRWTGRPTEAEYFWDIYQLLLDDFAKSYPDRRYTRALFCLMGMKLFEKGAKGELA